MTNATAVILTLAPTPAGQDTAAIARCLGTTTRELQPLLDDLHAAGAITRRGDRWCLSVPVPTAISRYISTTSKPA